MTTRNDPGDDLWRDLENNLNDLYVLKDTGPGNLRDRQHDDSGRSKLSLSLDIALSLCSSSAAIQSQQYLDVVLDLIIDNLPEDEVYVKASIPNLSRCIVISNLRNARRQLPPRQLPFPPQHARLVLRSLVGLGTEVKDGQMVYGIAKSLARPYLDRLDPTDPLVLAFSSRPSPLASLHSASLPSSPMSKNAQALSRHLDDPSIHPLSSPIQITAEDLLGIIAPAYLSILKSAPSPPLGIPSTYSQSVTGQANMFAGKVYSSHEFRNREVGLPMGLGVGRRGSNHVHQAQQVQQHGAGGGYGYGSTALPGMNMGMGLGVSMVQTPRGDAGGGKMARPASRHVDDYAR